MVRISIKALSLNQAYRGRRFATIELKKYKTALGYLLPKKTLEKGKLRVWYTFGMSSAGGDGDNLIKCFQDALADKYGFNDNMIYEWNIKKEIVKKGEEYIDFEIKLC